MPRPVRVHVEGALYHVTSRAAEQGVLFRGERDYRAYLNFLKEAAARYGAKLFAYVLLPDHLHLCLEPTADATLSTVMHAANSRYTKYVAKHYGHEGHVFQDRFKSTVLEKSQYLLPLTGYLHLHPQRTGLCADAAQYRWSSYAEYRAPEASVEPLVAEAARREVMEVLARETPGRDYGTHVRTQPVEAWTALREQLTHPVAGSEAFVGMVAQYQKLAIERKRSASAPSVQTAPLLQFVEAGPVSQPRPSGPRRLVLATYAVAFVSLLTAALYSLNLQTLQRTVQVLTQERRLLANGLFSDLGRDASKAQLANFSAPTRLGGAVINIELRPVSGAEQVVKDQIEFRGEHFVARQLKTQGFAPSKYTMTPSNHGVVWETAQTNAGGAILFWRGEWDGQTMRGILTRQVAGQADARFQFVGFLGAATPTDEI